jgi:methionyl-tRNA formyltransferase
MKIVYIGSGEFGIDSLDALARSGNSLRLVVTGSARPSGRGRKPRPTPVANWAKTHCPGFIEVESANTPEVIAEIAAVEPDLIVVIAFGQKISNELIKLPPKGIINVHASLLPKYRGAAPINWPILNGETHTGVSIISLIEEMDAGSILGQVETEIGRAETAGQLHDRLAKMAAPLLLQTIDSIADGSVVHTEQNHSQATPAQKLKKADGFLDFNDSAEALERKIRGLWPWPGASALYISKRSGRSVHVTIAMAQVVESSASTAAPAGTLDENLNVVCGRGGLKITKIKPANSALMAFKDFVNGRQTEPGDLFVKIDQ